ncbi:MAG: gliding motility-associated C-terminal domain-containing protein, partial [Cytophagaceae bacterium]
NTVFTRLESNRGISLFFPRNAGDGILSCQAYEPVEDGEDVLIFLIQKPINISTHLSPEDLLGQIQCPDVIGLCLNSFIDGLTIHDLESSNTGCSMGAYSDLTQSHYTTTLVLGTTYSAEITLGKIANEDIYVGLWLDYDNDGDFSGPHEFLNASFSKNSVIRLSNLRIQQNPDFTGVRRLRVRCRSGSPFNAGDTCPADGEIGETEDYAITLATPEPLIAPEFISPNDDGYNDYFLIRGLNSTTPSNLLIINKLGNVLYQEKNYQNNWNGRGQNGELLPKGTYYYVFTHGDEIIKGFFELQY